MVANPHQLKYALSKFLGEGEYFKQEF